MYLYLVTQKGLFPFSIQNFKINIFNLIPQDSIKIIYTCAFYQNAIYLKKIKHVYCVSVPLHVADRAAQQTVEFNSSAWWRHFFHPNVQEKSEICSIYNLS